jgi:hypothetical protein
MFLLVGNGMSPEFSSFGVDSGLGALCGMKAQGASTDRYLYLA